MSIFRWDNNKNELLKQSRGVCFEQVVLLMEKGEILDNLEHPNQEKYPGQKIAVVMIEAYAYIGGLILCKNSTENVRAYTEYYAKQPQPRGQAQLLCWVL